MTDFALTPQRIMTISPIIPVIAIEDAGQAIELAHALIEGGIKILEITLRTGAALQAISRIAAEVPGATVGAGTVLSSNDLLQAMDAGAQFAISPGSTPELLAEAAEQEYPLLPGVATASEIMLGMDLGYQHFKLFPAMTAGGIGALKSFSGPFQSTMFCPTGGISEDNFKDFLALDNVLCIGGSWLTPKDILRDGKFSEITAIAKSAMGLL